MKTVPVSEAHEGDILARDLRAADQSMILAKGAALSASMLVRLARMGVAEVTVETDAAQAADELEKQRAAVERRFAGHEADPYLMEMKRIVLARLDSSAGPGPETPTAGAQETRPC